MTVSVSMSSYIYDDDDDETLDFGVLCVDTINFKKNRKKQSLRIDYK